MMLMGQLTFEFSKYRSLLEDIKALEMGKDGFWDLLGNTFESMDWVEEEIALAQKRHPARADEVWIHTFINCLPSQLLTIRNERLYRAHFSEIADRVGQGHDLSLPTRAEIACLFHDASLRQMLKRSGVGIALMNHIALFPDDEEMLTEAALLADIDATKVGYFEEYQGQIEHEMGWINKKFSQDWRKYKEN